ncbi:MAG: ATP-binding cassette domain-containing protein [Chitinophagaceae bacterium]|nr:ATP-binding cassette domain-containing protein [Chitinophagaceae bacterium]
MNNVMIQVEELSKCYKLGNGGSGNLSTDIQQWWTNKRTPLPSESEKSSKQNQLLWSLNNVSFSVQRGDVYGIIGKNGAGKSTLLKLLSKITKPTKGVIKLNGRLASLLEVGTGFHPDLSGRENVFLNGAILGMRKSEIKQKFDEIVAFAGIEKFIDTPVKRYSSGMFVRLGFAVAAHLDPEILIVDEVLAVGDYEFQQKCLGKMKDVASEGRTILFVSHSIAAIKQLCNKALLLKQGVLEAEGKVSDVVGLYQNEMKDLAAGIRADSSHAMSGFTSWKLKSEKISGDHSCYSGEQLNIVVGFKTSIPLADCEVRMMIKHEALVLLHCTSLDTLRSLFRIEGGEYRFQFSVDFPIRDAQFDVEFSMFSIGNMIDIWQSSTKLTVLDSHISRVNPGVLNVVSEFEVFKVGHPVSDRLNHPIALEL